MDTATIAQDAALDAKYEELARQARGERVVLWRVLRPCACEAREYLGMRWREIGKTPIMRDQRHFRSLAEARRRFASEDARERAKRPYTRPRRMRILKADIELLSLGPDGWQDIEDPAQRDRVECLAAVAPGINWWIASLRASAEAEHAWDEMSARRRRGVLGRVIDRVQPTRGVTSHRAAAEAWQAEMDAVLTASKR